jgi:hypothetical protein
MFQFQNVLNPGYGLNLHIEVGGTGMERSPFTSNGNQGIEACIKKVQDIIIGSLCICWCIERFRRTLKDAKSETTCARSIKFEACSEALLDTIPLHLLFVMPDRS